MYAYLCVCVRLETFRTLKIVRSAEASVSLSCLWGPQSEKDQFSVAKSCDQIDELVHYVIGEKMLPKLLRNGRPRLCVRMHTRFDLFCRDF
jgi:hypothetical protein